MSHPRALVVLFLCLVLPTASCGRSRTVQKAETIMGTTVTMTVVARSAAEGESAIDAGMAELKRFDSMMSLYKDDSEVSKVNRAAGKRPVKVSPEMIEIVTAASEASKASQGTFDITVGPLVVLWQMRLKEGAIPADGELTRVKALVNWRNIVIDARASTLFLKKTGMIMDLGGMKGYMADRVADLFRKRGVNDALIAVAGDIWALGRREDGKPWRIGVQHPREKDKVVAVLDLTDRYVSTSGDYERFVIRENKRYHHIIDPRTGKPSKGVISATLIGHKGSLIDPLAKVPFILGPKVGLEIVSKIGAEAIVVDEAGKVFMSDGMKELMEQPAR